jgi:hypothetical protein
MPPKVSAADEQLMAAYQEAALRLSRILAEAKGSNRRKVLAEVNALLAQLDQLSARYITEQVPIQYTAGSDEAIAELKKVEGFPVDETFSTLHTEALNVLAQDASDKFANALQGVRKEASSLITAVQKQEIQKKILQSQVEGAARPQDLVKTYLEQEGIVSLRGARKWTLEDYSAMVARTTLAEAHNTGAINRYLTNGVQYGEVIERATAPDGTCMWMRGKIVFLGDRRLIPPFHPNCMGGVKPFLGTPVEPIMSPDDPRIPAEVRLMLLRR